jgi:hypothetical protein
MRPKQRRNRRGSREAEWIPSKTSSKVAIRSEVKARERKSNRPKCKLKEKEQAVGSDKGKEKKRSGCRDAECIPSKACSNAAIQSEVSAKLSENSDETY